MNFLAVKNTAAQLVQNGYRQIDPALPLGPIVAGDRLFVTKNDSSIYAFQIGSRALWAFT